MAEKSLTDYILTGLGIAVTAAVAFAGYRLSLSADILDGKSKQFETENKQYAVISDFLRKCTSNDSADRNYVDFFLSDRYDLTYAHPALLNDKDFDTQFRKAKRACYKWLQESQSNAGLATTGNPANATPSGRPSPSSPFAIPIKDSPAYAKRWVYLGTYGKDRHWVTEYFNNLRGFDPSKYQSSKTVIATFTVNAQTGAVNVRSGTFLQGQAFPPVVNSLSPGTQVQVVRTWAWFGSDNWWAEIK